MGFLDVDDVERDAIVVGAVEAVERGNLPAEGGSSVAAEDEHDGLAAMGGEFHAGGIVGSGQVEVGSGVAGLERAGASRSRFFRCGARRSSLVLSLLSSGRPCSGRSFGMPVWNASGRTRTCSTPIERKNSR